MTMKKFKGTKGPWEIFDYNGLGSCIDISLSEEHDSIAQVYSPTEIGYKDEQTIEHRANARLISLCPELLEFAMFIAKHEKGSAPSAGYFQEMIEKAEVLIDDILDYGSI